MGVITSRSPAANETASQGLLTPARRLWISAVLWVAGLAFAAAGLLLLPVNGPTLAAHPGIFLFPLQLTSGLPYLILGGLIFARRPANAIGWVIGGAGLAGVISFFVRQYAIYTLLTRPGALPFGDLASWLYNWLWALPITFYPLFVLLYPDGKPPSPGWRWAVWFDSACILAISLPFAVALWGMQGPASLDPAAYPGWLVDYDNSAFDVLLLLGLIASLIATVVRYRRAQSVERAQIRWLVYAVTCLVLLIVLSDTLLSGTDDPTAIFGLPDIYFLLVPIAVGVAIFRYHLFDIDRLINRTIVYGLLTAILALVYFGGVALLQTLLRPLTGEGNELAVVITTLLIAALFLPLRRVVQGFIDRRFYRRKYDAAKTLATFSDHLRDEVELDKLVDRLIGVADETMQPDRAALWLAPPSGTPPSSQ